MPKKPVERTKLSCCADVAALVRPIYRRYRWEQEAFVVLLLDVQLRLTAQPIVVSLGTLASCEVHPRDVFRAAVRANAHAVIVSHCHPSGDCAFSPADLRLTERLRQAGELLGIQLLDHVIVTRDESRAYSIAYEKKGS